MFFMNILYLAPEISIPGTHGGSSHVESAVTSLVELGHSVVLLSKYKKNKPLYARKKNLTTLRFPVLPTGIPRNFCFVFYSFFVSLFLSIFWADLIYERARIFGGTGVFVSWLFGKKSLYEMIEPYTLIPSLNGDLNEDSFIYRLIHAWHFAVVRRATKVMISHDSFLSEVKGAHYILFDSGVDTKQFNPNIPHNSITKKYHLKKGHTFLYIGSFQPWHACEQLIKAFSAVHKTFPNAALILIGDGVQVSLCKQLVGDLSLTDSIMFTGELPFNHIQPYIAAADICLSIFDRTYPPFKKLSYYYSPIKIHEYKAMGKPIIASDMGTLKRLIHPNINGILVNEQSITSIVNAMLTFLKRPKLAQTIGDHNRKEAIQQFDWKVIHKKLLKQLLVD